MEVVAMNGNAPFKREVHEWKHIDAKTGAMLSGRAEANRYVNGNINTYGKVSDVKFIANSPLTPHHHFMLYKVISESCELFKLKI
jgi:hypothetical protein